MIDVLLTYPKERVNYFHYMIPMGLAYIAGLLEQQGYSVKVLDFNFYHDDFQKDLKQWKPKIVGIGGTTATRKGSFLTARLTREILPDTPIIYGGPHASFTADDTLNHVPEIDYIVRSEGEFPFLHLTEHFTQTREHNISNIAGLSFRNGNKNQHNKIQRIQNLDSLPLPARHLFDGQYHISLDFVGVDAEFLMTSRGCTHGCSFCAATKMFPGGIRYRSMNHVQQEIEDILSRKKIGGLKIFDSTFTASKEHVLNFCEMIKPYHLLWECEVRADTVDYELLRQMKEAGCCYIDIGLETANQKLLDQLNKQIRPEQVENVLDWAGQLDIRTKVFFIFGHLNQTIPDCLEDIAYLKTHKEKIDLFSISVGMKVYPGTPLEKQCQKAGIIPPDFSWATYCPPKLNYLLFLFDDMMFVIQKQLNHFHLFGIMVRLFFKGMLSSREYARKLVKLNIKKFLHILYIKLLFTSRRIHRKLKSIRSNIAYSMKIF
ncbi:B12-binding domain-containing radical SAM protein [bacterium]